MTCRTQRVLFSLPFLLAIGACNQYGASNSSVSATYTGASSSAGGTVMGGSVPISGANIVLYQLGTGGDGTAASSIMNNGVTVTTATNGYFSLKNSFTCPASNPDVYLLATGGNPGLSPSSTNNSAIALMVALGSCNGIISTTVITVNEVTTVAAVAALAGYMTGPTNVASSTVDESGIASAFTQAGYYANTTTGYSPGSSVPTGYTVPTSTINTLANVIATCVDTAGGTAGQNNACGYLFSDTTYSTGTAPTNVVNALLNILNNPTTTVNTVLGLANSQSPFEPVLSSTPNSWTIALSDTGATWTGGGDGVWRRNANTIYGEAYTFDPCNAHQPGSGEYHYHENPVCLRYELNDNITGSNVGTSTATYAESTGTHTHSPILGWAFDGNPVYGPYGYSTATNSASAVRRMVSSYALRTDNTSTRTTLPAWAAEYQGLSATLTSSQYGPPVNSTYPLGRYVEDYAYTAGSGDLDQYNGRYCVTPDFPNGTYAYFVTIDSSGNAAFPYYLGPQFNSTVSGGNITSLPSGTTTYYSNHTIIGSSSSPTVTSWLKTFTSQLAEILYDNNGTLTGPTTTWTGNTTALDADVQDVYYDSTYAYLYISGLASHLMGPWYLNAAKTQAFPNLPTNQKTYSKIPLTPAVASTKTATGGGAQGRWVNGVSMFNMLDFYSWSYSEQEDVGPGAP